MKKFLLLSTAACMAFGAAAELRDITPAGYDFAKNPNIPHIDGVALGHGVWNPTPFWLGENPDYYNDGCVLWVGNADFSKAMEGCGTVDLGGNIGRVFYLNRPGSDINEQLEAITNRKFNISEGFDGYCIPLWHCNPEEFTGDEGVRVRMVINIYHNDAQFTGNDSQFQPYFQSASNSTYGDNEPASRKVYSGDFTLRWGEYDAEDGKMDWTTATPDDMDYFLDDEDNTVWNYNRWMVYEFDLPTISADEAPWKIKMEIPGGNCNGSTLFIKELKILAKDGTNDDIEPCTRRKTWVYYDINDNTSIGTIAADKKGLSVNVNGSEVSFGETAAVYTTTGALVANVAAGKTVSLEKGIYVAAANGKSVKFVVK